VRELLDNNQKGKAKYVREFDKENEKNSIGLQTALNTTRTRATRSYSELHMHDSFIEHYFKKRPQDGHFSFMQAMRMLSATVLL
jgi:hypothetical protein